MSDFPPNVSIRPLTIEDIDQCIALEAKGFKVAERIEAEHKDSKSDNEQEDDDLPVKSSVTKETLIGHIIATKIHSSHITEASMELPSENDPTAGHIEHSRFVGIHGLVVDPEWQGKNLGTLLMHDYIQKLSNQDLGLQSCYHLS
ncbi:hypothetical protein QCA50_012205 [Cerrena zonata]|uniref:N-acetyltransferase domain-containing protein n=1 Tax=Cerrena zonata TaxID=2478898 RepID=A0AAW0G2K7_9APHY